MRSIIDQKSQLRVEIKKRRSELSLDLFKHKSELIGKNLISFVLQKKAEVIHCFISMNDRFEVNTHPFIEDLLKVGKQVIVPIMNGEILEHSELKSMGDLERNSWGVIEPKKKAKTDIHSIDIIFVPLLGIDKQGNRLGYGKGYYDRFLEYSSGIKIGLVFEDFVYEEIPFEAHDIKLDGFITEKGVRLL